MFPDGIADLPGVCASGVGPGLCGEGAEAIREAGIARHRGLVVQPAAVPAAASGFRVQGSGFRVQGSGFRV